MKKLLAFTLIGYSLLLVSNSVKADWDHWGVKANSDGENYDIYTIDSSNGEETLRTSTSDISGITCGSMAQCKPDISKSYVNSTNGQLILKFGNLGNKYYGYDLNSDSWTSTNTFSSNYIESDFIKRELVTGDSSGNATMQVGGTKILSRDSAGTIQIGGDADDIDIVADGFNIDGAAVITKNTDGSIQIGTDGNDIDITSEGLNVDGNPLITKKDNGEIHIGKNSLITKSEEETLSDGTKVQPLYAKDADGNKIPINIDGSKLLIDGVEVTAGGDSAQVTTNKNDISTNKANIKSLGEGVAGSTALTAALSALPQTSKESKLSCGVGTGAYSSRYAVGFGCASQLNERFDVNAGGSYVFGGSKYYGGGTLDSGVVRAGFVFKLGESNKPIQISMKDKKVMETKIGTLIDKNEKLQNKVSILMARLERLEKIASRDIKSQDLVLIKN